MIWKISDAAFSATIDLEGQDRDREPRKANRELTGHKSHLYGEVRLVC